MMYKLLVKSLGQLSYSYDERANHTDDAGMDLYVQRDTICAPNQVTFIRHQISCEMLFSAFDKFLNKYTPKSSAYLLVPRSSISKTPLLMANSVGIIDAGYRGEIIGAVYNTSNREYTVTAGTRLFQIVAPNLDIFTVEIVNELSETKRGSGGFGSTGQ